MYEYSRVWGTPLGRAASRLGRTFMWADPEKVDPIEFQKFRSWWLGGQPPGTSPAAFNMWWDSLSRDAKWNVYREWYTVTHGEPEWYRRYEAAGVPVTDAESILKLGQAEEKAAVAEYLRQLTRHMAEEKKKAGRETLKQLAREAVVGLSTGIAQGAQAAAAPRPGAIARARTAVAGEPQVYTPAPRAQFGPPQRVYHTPVRAAQELSPDVTMPRAAAALTQGSVRAGRALIMPSRAGDLMVQGSTRAAEAMTSPAATTPQGPNLSELRRIATQYPAPPAPVMPKASPPVPSYGVLRDLQSRTLKLGVLNNNSNGSRLSRRLQARRKNLHNRMMARIRSSLRFY